MDAITFNTKFDAHGAARTKTKVALENLQNLAWKLIQPGCNTPERAARVEALRVEYNECLAAERAIWAN